MLGFDKFCIFSLNFENTQISILMKMLPFGADFFKRADGRTEKRPDVMKLIVAFRNSVQTSNKYLTCIKLTSQHLFPTLDQSRLNSHRIRISNFCFISNYKRVIMSVIFLYSTSKG
jgi:hypothetical protein